MCAQSAVMRATKYLFNDVGGLPDFQRLRSHLSHPL
jgi:hypothetical protein